MHEPKLSKMHVVIAKISSFQMFDVDPHLCTCGPCKQFWKQNFGGTKLKSAPKNRSADTSLMYAMTQKGEDHPAILKVGDRVQVRGTYQGVVKYIGTLNDHLIAPQCYVGVHLDEQVNSTHNGVHKGKRFFHCPRGHGAFVNYCDVVRVNPPEKRPPVSGNTMYPNYKDMLQRRKARAQKDPSMAEWGAPYNRQVTITVYDKNDIAAKDQERSDKNKQQTSNRKDEVTREDIAKWKQKFGGDERAEAMAMTLRKLHLGHKKAKLYEMEEENSTTGAGSAEKKKRTISFSAGRRVSTVR